MTREKIEANKIIYKKPLRIFEDSGAVIPQKAYYVGLDNVTNTKKQDLKTMVDQSRCFSMFAPRQSGKTTFLEELRSRLHDDPTYVVVILGFQNFKNLTDKSRFYSLLQKYLYEQLLKRLEQVNCDKIETVRQFLARHHFIDHISFRELFEELNRIIQYKKIVIFIDEFDGIPINELENFLTTLRELYIKYKLVKQKALYSIGLIGIRNITKLIVGGVSPFNIADQVEIPPFSLKNVRDIYSQFSEETIRAIERYPWPGNVRELKNVVERAVYRSDSSLITDIVFDPFLSPLPDYQTPIREPLPVKPASLSLEELMNKPINEAVRQVEIYLVKRAIRDARYNQRKAAQRLGLTYHQFRGLYRKYREEIT